MEMLTLLLRHDVELPPSAVALFTKRIIDDTLQVRKVVNLILDARPHRDLMIFVRVFLNNFGFICHRA